MNTCLRSSWWILCFFYYGISQTAGDAVSLRQNELGFGVRDMAMGGNGVASSRDYSAVYWNPAGLASLRSIQISGGLSYLRFSNNATFAENFMGMQNNYTRFRDFGVAIPLPATRGSLVLALGYNFVKDFDDYLSFSGFNRISNDLEFELQDINGNYQWYPFDRDVQQSEEVYSEGGLGQWSLAGAVALSPSFDVGVTLNFWNGSEKYYQHFLQEDIQNLYSEYPADFDYYRIIHSMETDYKAFNAKMGGIIKLNRAARVGFAVEFPATFTVTEAYASSDELAFDDGYLDAVEYEPGTWQYQIQTPYQFDAGVGIQQRDFAVTAGVKYQDWKQTRFKVPGSIGMNADYSALLQENLILQKEYRETISYHVGGEFSLPQSILLLRGGYAVHPSPLRNATADMNRHIYSGGVGFRIGLNTFLDATYLHSSWKRETEDVYTPGGTLEEITENRILIGLRINL